MPLPEFLEGAKGKAAAALLAVFLAGGGAGYIAGRWQAHYSFREAALERRIPASFARGGRQLRRLRRDLHLRDEQFTRVNTGLQRHLEEMQLLRREMRPQVEKLLLEAQGELSSILDSDQRQIFDKMVRSFGHSRRRWRDRMMRRFFPGGHGSDDAGRRRTAQGRRGRAEALIARNFPFHSHALHLQAAERRNVLMFSKRTVIIAALAAAAILTAADVALAHGIAAPGRFGKMHGMRARFARASFGGAQRLASPPLISIALRHQDELKLTGDQVAKLTALRDAFSRKWIRARADLQIANLDLRNSLREDAVNLEVVGRQIRDIEKKKADLRLERIRAIEEGKALLTEDQRKQLLSFVQSGPRHGAGPRFSGMMGPGQGMMAPGAAAGGSQQGAK